MKTKTILLLLLTSFVMGSCSKKDDVEPEKSSVKLIGKWLFSEHDGKEKPTACEKTSYITFLKGGKASVVFYYDASNGDCKLLMGSELTYERISDDSIKFTDLNGESSISKISVLSENKLVLNGFVLSPDAVITFIKSGG